MAELYDRNKRKRRVRIRGMKLNDRTREVVVEMQLNPTGEELAAVLSVTEFLGLVTMIKTLGTQLTEEELYWGNGDHDDNDDLINKV